MKKHNNTTAEDIYENVKLRKKVHFIKLRIIQLNRQLNKAGLGEENHARYNLWQCVQLLDKVY